MLKLEDGHVLRNSSCRRNSTCSIGLRSDLAKENVQNLVIVFFPKLQTSLISGDAASAISTIITDGIRSATNSGIEEWTPIIKTGNLP